MTPHVRHAHAQFLYAAKEGLLYAALVSAHFLRNFLELPLFQMSENEADPLDLGQVLERRGEVIAEIMIRAVALR